MGIRNAIHHLPTGGSLEVFLKRKNPWRLPTSLPQVTKLRCCQIWGAGALFKIAMDKNWRHIGVFQRRSELASTLRHPVAFLHLIAFLRSSRVSVWRRRYHWDDDDDWRCSNWGWEWPTWTTVAVALCTKRAKCKYLRVSCVPNAGCQ